MDTSKIPEDTPPSCGNMSERDPASFRPASSDVVRSAYAADLQRHAERASQLLKGGASVLELKDALVDAIVRMQQAARLLR